MGLLILCLTKNIYSFWLLKTFRQQNQNENGELNDKENFN